MKITVNGELKGFDVAKIVPVFEGTDNKFDCDTLSKRVNSLFDTGKFSGKFGSTYNLSVDCDGKIKDIIILGLGKREEINNDKIRIGFAKACKKARELKAKKIGIDILNLDVKSVKPLVEGVGLPNYVFDKYKSCKNEDLVEELIIKVSSDSEDIVKAIVAEAEVLVNSTFIARDLVNEPANTVTPLELSKRAESYGKEFGFEVEVFGVDKIKELKMDAFYSVSKGSDNEPKVIVMRYFGDSENKDNILGLVGKGLTYDAGGYSIKSSDGMVTMNGDMGGSAAVIGAMCAVSKMKLKVNVVSVICACENLISGHSYKPGDIISSMAGKTIHIENTDAEGRLTLADAVYYTVTKENVKKIVDIATLTGAVRIALGDVASGLIGNNEAFINEVKNASTESGEKVWELPVFDEYKEDLKSYIADLKNVGSKGAGTIMGGLFIGEFVNNTPWAHIDIASTSWNKSNDNLSPRGGNGVGVRTLYYICKNFK